MSLYEKLAVISGLSVQLLDSTDKLNAHIAAIEVQFREAHPMVRAFVQITPEWYLGFGKVKNGWCFLARHGEAGDVEPLTSTPREVRVASCQHFEALAAALVQAMATQQIEMQHILNGTTPVPPRHTTTITLPPPIQASGTVIVTSRLVCPLCGGEGNSVAMSHKDGCPEIR
ncbi:MAG: hypothetical protein A2Y38_17425 [Spirochaetes bacterium GWB1_59_5]|nr:MAG: hypothetical protein A2Y38_17425 [Spirochaetes bacterium GWB1_59_5]